MTKTTICFSMLFSTALMIGCGDNNGTSSNTTPKPPSATADQVDTALPDDEAIMLRYRFQQGQRMDYVTNTTMTNKYPMLNQESTFEMDVNLHVTVDSVEADGSASMTWTHDRMKMKLQGPGGTVRFDSADGEEPDNPMWQQMRVAFFPIQFVQFTFRVTTNGIISDVKLTEAAAARLEKDPSLAFIFSPPQLQENPRQLFHPLPSKPVKPTETWNYIISSEPFPGAKIEVALTHSYQGLEKLDEQQLARLNQTRKTNTEFGPESFFTMAFKDDLTVASEWFDPKLGWAVKTDGTTAMITVNKQQGVSLEVEQTVKIIMRLSPAHKADSDPEITTESSKPTTP